MAMPFVIEPIRALADNYIWLIADPEAKLAAVVDPGEAGPVMRVLKERQWNLSLIFITHHHGDHTGGNAALKQAYGACIVGPYAERGKIGNLDRAVEEGETVDFLGLQGTVISLPGHTLGHIAFHFPAAAALFCGDALFSMGCGRLFEGAPEVMWHSLQKLRLLPPETKIYCGHEYTEANLRFALTLDKDNAAMQEKMRSVQALRHQGAPTLPAILTEELRLNPFLRADCPAFQQNLARLGFPVDGFEPAAVFTAIRAAKDRFR